MAAFPAISVFIPHISLVFCLSLGLNLQSCVCSLFVVLHLWKLLFSIFPNWSHATYQNCRLARMLSYSGLICEDSYKVHNGKMDNGKAELCKEYSKILSSFTL